MLEHTTVLITGGAGYIGSHAVLALRAAGCRAIVLDDLSSGRRAAVPEDVPFVEGDVGDIALVREVFRKHGVSAVVHFAGSIVVPESVRDPLKYYRNNTCASRNLLEACIDNRVRHFIFSSTAAVYGIPEQVPVSETAPTRPINPYGASKLATEWMLRDTAAARDFDYVALRYFNVAGADPLARSGQSSQNPTHLIEVVSQVALGLRDHLEIFGDDYDTPDGTCIRDYIHVSDLAEAHVLALRHLLDGGPTVILNLGNERGFSVREVVAAARRVTGRSVPVRIGPRRPGDPAQLVADATQARRLLAWRPARAEIDTQIADAWRWHRRCLGGAGSGGG
ncbi:MAG: UDP-glucose 4-epimerase GalE [Kiloniellaceae bacterium]